MRKTKSKTKSKRVPTLALWNTLIQAVSAPEEKTRWYRERSGPCVAPYWHSLGLAPINLTVERIRRGCYDYGGAGRYWGSSRTLALAKQNALLKLIKKLAMIGDNARTLLRTP